MEFFFEELQDAAQRQETVYSTIAGPDGVRRLITPIQPSDANHSFNGILFDVRCISMEDVEIVSVAVGGDIGPWQVFAKPASIRTGFKRRSDGWVLVGKGVSEPCWRGSQELPLSVPVVIPAGETHALFVHSSLNHDRGILYQTYPNVDAPICRDRDLSLFPGEARIGSVPFADDDDDQAGRWGWYRGPRGLAGHVSYRTRPKLWSPETHRIFPVEFQLAIVTVLLCWQREECGLSILPLEALFTILRKMYWRDWVLTSEHPRATRRPSL